MGLRLRDVWKPVVYGLLNIVTASGIVFANKAVMTTFGFKFIYALTLIHTITTLFGMKAFAAFGMFEAKALPKLSIAPLAGAYVGYIVLNNLNLQMNTVGFYQISKIAVAPAVRGLPGCARVLPSACVPALASHACGVRPGGQRLPSPRSARQPAQAAWVQCAWRAARPSCGPRGTSRSGCPRPPGLPPRASTRTAGGAQVLLAEAVFFGKRATKRVVASIVLVCLGVGLSTVTDTQVGLRGWQRPCPCSWIATGCGARPSWCGSQCSAPGVTWRQESVVQPAVRAACCRARAPSARRTCRSGVPRRRGGAWRVSGRVRMRWRALTRGGGCGADGQQPAGLGGGRRRGGVHGAVPDLGGHQAEGAAGRQHAGARPPFLRASLS